MITNYVIFPQIPLFHGGETERFPGVIVGRPHLTNWNQYNFVQMVPTHARNKGERVKWMEMK